MYINTLFEDFYRSLYGERWEALRAALCAPKERFSYSEGLAEPYFMDRASVLAAQSLPVPDDADGENSLILDMCAAPGGKSLVIASRMGGGVRLLSNELSADRRRRLTDVLDRHLSAEKRERVTVTAFDAAAAGGRKTERGRFAAVLLDAPCSSEAHVLADPKAYAAWRPARPRFLAQRQWALLSSAWLLLSPGGTLVYAACTVNGGENDGVAARLVKKYGGEVVIDPPGFDCGEAARFGRMILPDSGGGLGPMYTARFKKRFTA